MRSIRQKSTSTESLNRTITWNDQGQAISSGSQVRSAAASGAADSFYDSQWRDHWWSGPETWAGGGSPEEYFYYLGDAFSDYPGSDSGMFGFAFGAANYSANSLMLLATRYPDCDSILSGRQTHGRIVGGLPLATYAVTGGGASFPRSSPKSSCTACESCINSYSIDIEF